MFGGTGNDTYDVDNTLDVVVENPAEGADTVLASVNYILAAGIEVETLKANAATGLRLTGNSYSHNLVGNTGNDTLVGGAGNDTLNGGAGADSMVGSAGNDSYYVDRNGDRVIEVVGGGNDTIWASANYTLASGSEVETLQVNSTTGLRLTGNTLSHNLVGNTGNDTLTGGTGNDDLNGGTANDSLVGGLGNDTLVGGAGNDTMKGGSGNDVFQFQTGFGQDTIRDFLPSPVGSQDLLDISALGIAAANFATSVKISGAGNGGTKITIGAESIRLINVAPTNIGITDFRLA